MKTPVSAEGRPKTQFVSRRWLVALAVLAAAIMELLDTTVVNVSLPHMAGSLASSVDEATWVLTSYIVANAIIMPITGWLSNYFGRKRLLLTVVTGFTLSSALCGMAPNLPLLILFRVMQGLAGGGLQPISQSVLLEEFPGHERGKAMSLWSMGIITAPVLGPTIGGWITDTFSWRWVFYINLPVGILSLILISIFVSDPHYIRRGTMRFDAWGMGMLALGMGSLQIMLDKGQEDDWFGSGFIRVLALVAGVMLTAFVIRQLRIPNPLVKLALLRNRNFAAGIVVVVILSSVMYGSLVTLPLFMQEMLGWTAETAGLWTSPRGLATVICMPVVGYLLDRHLDARWMVLLGMRAWKYGLLRLFAHEPEFRHMGHLRTPDQSRSWPDIPLRAVDNPGHGYHRQGGNGLRDQPLRRDAQYRLQHGRLSCHDRHGPPRAVPSEPPLQQHGALEPATAADAAPNRGRSQPSRRRHGRLRTSISRLCLRYAATAGCADELCRRLSFAGMAFSANVAARADHAQAEALRPS